MNENECQAFERLSNRYEAGETPWDEPLPPPEVISFLKNIAPGRALDLGCGFGRAAIYMASLGWDVDAVDFVPRALAIAKDRANAAGVSVSFHQAQITKLDFLRGPYDFALDVGCCHNLDDTKLQIYRDQLARLLTPGGVFMLFARIRGANDPPDEQGPVGLVKERLLSLFEDSFVIDSVSIGETTVSDQSPWSSAWFRWMKKPDDDASSS